MKAKCKAAIYLPASGMLYTEGKTYDLGEDMIRAYSGYFEPAEKTGLAPANKMVKTTYHDLRRPKGFN